MSELNLDNLKLIIGLGNIGEEYKYTRHNIGFLFLDTLKNSPSFSTVGIAAIEKKFHAELCTLVKKNGEKLLLAKPQTMMNNSGLAVRLLLDYYKFRSDQVLIVYDEMDIDVGKFKLSFDKTSHTHNGILSIQEKNPRKKFWYLRIGIESRTKRGNSEKPGLVHALEKMPLSEREKQEESFQSIIFALDKLEA